MNKNKKLKHISILGNGTYVGTMSGHVFTYNGKEYECSDGVRGLNCLVSIRIKDGKDEVYF